MSTREIPWGVVQEFVVEADTDSTLVAAMTILLSYHSTVSHFRIETDPVSREQTLRLLWSDDKQPGTGAFLSPMKTPQQIADEVRRWLDNATYDTKHYGGDGSTKNGFRVELDNAGWSYTFALITPTRIIYSK